MQDEEFTEQLDEEFNQETENINSKFEILNLQDQIEKLKKLLNLLD